MPPTPIDAGWTSRLPALPPDPDEELQSLRSASDAKLRFLFQLDYEQVLRQLPMPGWWPILAELHDGLVTLDPAYEFLQVKEKLGVLRVYVKVSPEASRKADEFIRSAEARSAETCERCGAAGRLRDDRRWKLTLCDDCDSRLPG